MTIIRDRLGAQGRPDCERRVNHERLERHENDGHERMNSAVGILLKMDVGRRLSSLLFSRISFRVFRVFRGHFLSFKEAVEGRTLG